MATTLESCKLPVLFTGLIDLLPCGLLYQSHARKGLTFQAHCPPKMQLSQAQVDLLALSHALGLESRQMAILGEGNTSCKLGDGTFLVKASGSCLATLTVPDISRVRLQYVLDLLDDQALSEQEIERQLVAALLDPTQRKPSVETFLHAVCLQLGEASWVGHTHTVSVNQILCSQHGAAAFARHLFPDVIVVCGRHVASVPYTDPGQVLAKAVALELQAYKANYGKPPKLLLLENHGPVALGQSPNEVLNIMLMADKWAKTLVGALAVGGPKYLSDADADRIDARLDEAYRRLRLDTQQLG